MNVVPENPLQLFFTYFTGPPLVITHPESQDIKSFSTATFTVAFENVRQIIWFKDSTELVQDQTTIRVYRATADDQGHYYATAIGEDGSIVSTNQATLTLNGKCAFFHIQKILSCSYLIVCQ